MAADDAQRIWFHEMVELLSSEWREDMPFDALIALRDSADALLGQIRLERHILRPVVRCPQCGHRSPAEEAHVTVRAMILALLRHEIASAESTYALEKAWARHRKQHALDLYGKPAPATPPPPHCPRCAANPPRP